MSQNKASLLEHQPKIKELEESINHLLSLLDDQKNMIKTYQFSNMNLKRKQLEEALHIIDDLFDVVRSEKHTFLKHDLMRLNELAQILHHIIQENMNLLSYAKDLQRTQLAIFDRFEKRHTRTYNSYCTKEDYVYQPILRTSL